MESPNKTAEEQNYDAVFQKNSTDYNLLNALLQSSSDSIYFKDLESRFIRVSEALARKHGGTAQGLIGKTDFDFFGPIHAQQAFDDEQWIIKTGQPIIGKEECEDSQDGNITWVTTSKMPLYDALGKIIGTFGISRDITRRKRAENIRETLFQISEAVYTTTDIYNLCKKIHEILEKLMHAKNLRIALLDPKKQTLTFPYFADIHDLQPLPRKLGKGLTEYVLKTGKPELLTEKNVSELIKKGLVELVDKPSQLWLGVPLKVSDNTIGVLILKDYENDKSLGEEDVQILTFVAEQIAQAIQRRINSEEIRKHTEELKNINSTKDKFFSIISHDLRAPLNGLLSFSELLLEDFAAQPEHEKELFIQNLQSSMKSLLSLTENLLTWARIQSSGITIEQQTINLKKLLNSVVETQLLVAGNKAITLEVICRPETEVYADYNMLETIVRNLVSNAIKFTNRRGKVIIKAFERDDEVLIQVQDSGIGMSTELVSNLFRIDQKVTREGTNSEKGTGLGLVICKEFIEKNGGSISVESAMNTGTTISVTLKSNRTETD